VLIPESSILLDPFDGVEQRRRSEPTAMDAAIDIADQQPGALEHFEMLRNGRLGYSERARKFSDGCLTSRQACNDRPACRVRKRCENEIEALLGGTWIVNH
jgi:hypothetical protein